MNIHIHSDRLDSLIALWFYMAAVQIPGIHVTSAQDADLVINVDSIHNKKMVRGKKTAYYEIDDTLHQGKNSHFYDVDLLYITSKAMLPLYPKNTRWLPMAMEPSIHYHWAFQETHDLVFIGETGGNDCYTYRKKILEDLSKEFDILASNCPPQNYAKFMSSGKIRINIMPHTNGMPPFINPRFFESMGMGFMMNDYDKTLDDLAVEGQHYIGFTDIGDAIEKAKFYLRNDANRQEIGERGKAHVLANHTWKHRLETILTNYKELI